VAADARIEEVAERVAMGPFARELLDKVETFVPNGVPLSAVNTFMMLEGRRPHRVSQRSIDQSEHAVIGGHNEEREACKRESTL
jgi:hypothetical protein